MKLKFKAISDLYPVLLKNFACSHKTKISFILLFYHNIIVLSIAMYYVTSLSMAAADPSWHCLVGQPIASRLLQDLIQLYSHIWQPE